MHAVTKEKASYPSHGLGSPSKKPADRCQEAGSAPRPHRPCCGGQSLAPTHPGHYVFRAQVLTEHLLRARQRVPGQRTGVRTGSGDKAVRALETHAPQFPDKKRQRPQAPRKFRPSVPPAVTFQGPKSRMGLAAAIRAANRLRPS